MIRSHERKGREGMAAVVALVSVIGAGILLVDTGRNLEFSFDSPTGHRKPTGFPQLVSIEPLPGMDGPMCQWVPASAQTPLLATLLQSRAATASSPGELTSVNADRAPERVIQDEYPSYSAVVVDPIRNEIIANDESLFQIMVFDRTANTPPNARFTEPKRVISGPATMLEFECGLYVDPKTGEIYTLNNDTGDRLAVFAPNAKGNVPPTRWLHTPHAVYGIVVDEERQEMYLSVQGGSVVVYHKFAQKEDKPLRTLRGPRTKLGRSTGIAIDTKKRLLFVANQGDWDTWQRDAAGKPILAASITVYSQEADGDVPPLRVIGGPKTQLSLPSTLYADEDRGELFVANDGGNSVLVFRVTDEGDVAPTRVLKGPKSGLKNPSAVFVDTTHDELVVTNLGDHSLAVYPRTANGDVAPLRIIRSAPVGKKALNIVNPGAAGYDSKREEILVPN